MLPSCYCYLEANIHSFSTCVIDRRQTFNISFEKKRFTLHSNWMIPSVSSTQSLRLQWNILAIQFRRYEPPKCMLFIYRRTRYNSLFAYLSKQNPYEIVDASIPQLILLRNFNWTVTGISSIFHFGETLQMCPVLSSSIANLLLWVGWTKYISFT